MRLDAKFSCLAPFPFWHCRKWPEAYLDACGALGFQLKFARLEKRLILMGLSMLNKCANAECEEEFKYFGEGRLFLRDESAVFGMDRGELMNECHWLCPECAKRYKVEFTTEGPMVKPLRDEDEAA
jgi:hypothetical protein